MKPVKHKVQHAYSTFFVIKIRFLNKKQLRQTLIVLYIVFLSDHYFGYGFPYTLHIRYAQVPSIGRIRMLTFLIGMKDVPQ